MIMDMNQAQRSRLPEFTYTGRYELVKEGHGNWHIDFLTSGKLTITSIKSGKKSDFFLLSAGQDGITPVSPSYRSGGGSGGKRKTHKDVQVENAEYEIIIGQENFNDTYIKKAGAKWLASDDKGYESAMPGRKGQPGSPGGHAFDDPSFPIYGGGGGGQNIGYAGNQGGDGGGGASGSSGSINGKNGAENHGGGGGAAYVYKDNGANIRGNPGKGSTGILIWRNHRKGNAA